MPTLLPDRPNLQYYQKKAKRLLKSFKDQDESSLARFTSHLNKILTLNDAQFVIAREHGCTSWTEFQAEITGAKQLHKRQKQQGLDVLQILKKIHELELSREVKDLLEQARNNYIGYLAAKEEGVFQTISLLGTYYRNNVLIAKKLLDMTVEIDKEAHALLLTLDSLHFPEMHCNFCGKSQREVKKLIAGPKAYVCDECVQRSVEILEKDIMLD